MTFAEILITWMSYCGNTRYQTHRGYLYILIHFYFLGKFIQGYEPLEKLVDETLAALPDLKLHIIDCFCEGNDNDG